jgi:hypothetical protein
MQCKEDCALYNNGCSIANLANSLKVIADEMEANSADLDLEEEKAAEKSEDEERDTEKDTEEEIED